LGIPTIAAVQGTDVGAGLSLALGCDLRVAGFDARFSAAFSQTGLHPGGGCTWFLVNAIGAQRAMNLLLDAGFLGGQEAMNVGLATCPENDPLEAVTRARPAVRRNRLSADLGHQVVGTDRRPGRLDPTLAVEVCTQASSATNPAVHELSTQTDGRVQSANTDPPSSTTSFAERRLRSGAAPIGADLSHITIRSPTVVYRAVG